MDIDSILTNDTLTEEDQQYHDVYATLNCSPDATAEQIATEYKALAMRYHPDKQRNHDPNAATKFDHISRAYSILSDDAQKAQYDNWRASGLRIPFPKWRALDQHAQTVHWQSAKPQPSITSGTAESKSNVDLCTTISSTQWKRSDSPVGSNLSRFRNNDL